MPDVWEKLPHFLDNIAKILFSAEDLVLNTRTMKFAFEMTDEDNYSSEHQDSDEIWVDGEVSVESEPEMNENANRWDSFEELTGEDGDATDFSVAVGQTEGEDDQPEKEQHSPSPSPMPSKKDSQPSLVSLSPSQASIEQSSKQLHPTQLYGWRSIHSIVCIIIVDHNCTVLAVPWNTVLCM